MYILMREAPLWFKYFITLFSFLIIILGGIVNFNRDRPTIPEFPDFVYIEHILGPSAIGIIFFSVFLLIFYLIKHYLIKHEYFNPITPSFIIGLIIALGLSIFYEVIKQKAETIIQLPFDFIGIILYIFYIRWAYPKNFN